MKHRLMVSKLASLCPASSAPVGTVVYRLNRMGRYLAAKERKYSGKKASSVWRIFSCKIGKGQGDLNS